MLGCFTYNHLMIDDPIEACHIFILPTAWAALVAVLFQDHRNVVLKTDEESEWTLRRNDVGNVDKLGT